MSGREPASADVNSSLIWEEWGGTIEGAQLAKQLNARKQENGWLYSRKSSHNAIDAWTADRDVGWEQQKSGMGERSKPLHETAGKVVLPYTYSSCCVTRSTGLCVCSMTRKAPAKFKWARKKACSCQCADQAFAFCRQVLPAGQQGQSRHDRLVVIGADLQVQGLVDHLRPAEAMRGRCGRGSTAAARFVRL